MLTPSEMKRTIPSAFNSTKYTSNQPEFQSKNLQQNQADQFSAKPIQIDMSHQQQNIKAKDLPSDELQNKLNLFIDKLFNQYDQQHKGFLAMDEFGKLLRENTGNDFSEQEVKNLLEIADTNKNKVIEKHQLVTLYKTLIKY